MESLRRLLFQNSHDLFLFVSILLMKWNPYEEKLSFLRLWSRIKFQSFLWNGILTKILPFSFKLLMNLVSILLMKWNPYEVVKPCKALKIKYLYGFCSPLFSSKFSRSMNFLGRFSTLFRKHNFLMLNNLDMIFIFFKINW